MLRQWLAGGSSVIATAALVACASSPSTGRGHKSQAAAGLLSSASGLMSADVPSRAAPSRQPMPRGTGGECGSVPRSSGPLAHLAYLAIKAPATVSVGTSVSVSTTVISKSVAPRVIAMPATSALLVVRDGRVVGQALGRSSAPRVPLQLTAGARLPAQTIPQSVRLTDCGSDSKGARLTAGRYALVAVLGYERDSLNAASAGSTGSAQTPGRSFALVSASAPIILG